MSLISSLLHHCSSVNHSCHSICLLPFLSIISLRHLFIFWCHIVKIRVFTKHILYTNVENKAIHLASFLISTIFTENISFMTCNSMKIVPVCITTTITWDGFFVFGFANLFLEMIILKKTFSNWIFSDQKFMEFIFYIL